MKASLLLNLLFIPLAETVYAHFQAISILLLSPNSLMSLSRRSFDVVHVSELSGVMKHFPWLYFKFAEFSETLHLCFCPPYVLLTAQAHYHN